MPTPADPPAPTATALLGTRAAPPRAFAVAAWLLAISVAVCLLGYLAVTVPGPWFGHAQPMHWDARAFGVTRGTAQLGADGLSLLAPDPNGTTLVALTTSFRASDYPQIVWQTSEVPDGVRVALIWRNDYQPGRVFSRELDVEGGRITAAQLARDPNWIGNIDGLALGLRGTFTQPILVRGATAKPMTAVEVLFDLVDEWLNFEPWRGTSINNRTGGVEVQTLPLTLLLALVVGLGALTYVTLSRWRPHSVGPLRPVVIAGMFAVAWFMLDGVWQWDLIRQVELTIAQYAGKSWRERHLAAEDGPLFAFIEKVRATLPPPPARVFMIAETNFFRDRGAYHLYPYNVYFDPWQNIIPPPSAMRSGDYLVVFQRQGVQYDAAQQHLRWDGAAPVSAELLLIDAGAALFRIR